MLRGSAAVIAITALALAMGSSGAVRANLVQNGDFSQVTNGPNGFLGPNGSSEPVDWSHNNAPMAIFAPGGADATGALENPYTLNGAVYDRGYLWGSNNPGPNSLNGLTATSPAGGNFLASDADPVDGAEGLLQQTISGLTPGQQYKLSFYYALAQFRQEDGSEFNGASFGSWQVSLGAQTQSTSVLNIASHGFSGWVSESFTYTATASSEVLSFFAVGGPAGVPPAMLLNGISLTGVPEPSTMLLASVGSLGLFGVGIARRLRGRVGSTAV